MKLVSITLITLRVLIALFTRSYFQPDEYYQSLEPAHKWVFGYGHLTWEWLTAQPLRSPIYPALNVPVYWLLKVTGLHAESPLSVVMGPRILHGIFASATDIWVYELARNIVGIPYASTAVFLSATSFFNALALSRSLSNSLETSLTTVAFSYYAWHVPPIWERSRSRKCIALAALTCAMRPTNAVIWVYLYSVSLWKLRRRLSDLLALAQDLLLIGSSALLALLAIDSFYFGRLTFTPLNFVLTNLSSVSLFYGANPWHYYWLQGLPIVCTTALPFALHCIWRVASRNYPSHSLSTACGCIIWTVAVYSLAGHKEWRFIHPLLPLLHVVASKSMVDLSKVSLRRRAPGKFHLPIRSAYFTFTLLNLVGIAYVVLFHCTAQITVMGYLRSLPTHELQSIGFLMPCHSTPWQAYLHRIELSDPGRFWALGCEPPLGLLERAEYKDQSRAFFENPAEYMQRRFPAQVNINFPPSPFPSSIPGKLIRKGQVTDDWKHEWPQNIVLFGELLEAPGMRSIFESKGYQEVWRAGWIWEGDDNRKGGVKVLRFLP